MKQILLLVVLGVLAFVASMAGVLFLMPAPAPAETTAAADTLQAAPVSMLPPDTLAALTDSLYGPSIALPLHEAIVATLRDSIRVLTERQQQLAEEAQLLYAERRGTPSGRAPSATAEQVAALTKTLSQLDDKELTAVLRQLDLNDLEQLFRSASARSRARMLAAMPAEQAGQLVRRLTRDPAPADSLERPVRRATSAPSTPATNG